MEKKNFLQKVLDLIFPPRCFGCGKLSKDVFCKDCLALLPIIEPPYCRRCGKPTNLWVEECRDCSGRRLYFSCARSVGIYESPLKEAIYKLKNRRGRALAGYFADVALKNIEADILKADLITYIPLTPSKEFKRSFNQAKVLAEEVSRRLDIPCVPLLKKIKETPDQSRLSLKERRENVKGVFEIAGSRKDSVRGRRILLIDDVFTTGETVREASRVLRGAGAKRVNVITVARATHNY